MALTKSFILVCRDAAKDCPDILIRKLLRDAVDELAFALGVLNEQRSVEAMQSVNILWAKAHRVLQKAYPTPEPIPPKSDAALEALAA